MTTLPMNSNPRHLKIAVAVVTTLVMLWFGINVYAGKGAESRLHELVAASGQSTSYRLRNLNHQRGMLVSHGYADLALIDECGAGSAPEWLTARITYQLKHSVFPLALMHIEWSMEPLGKERETFERVFAGQAKLEGRGKVGLTGDVQSDMTLPEIQWANKDTRVTVSPSVGSVTFGKDTLKLDWRTGKIAARGDGSALALDGLGLEIDLASVRRGLGKVAFTIDKLGTPNFNADGMSLVTLMRENANRIDIDVTPGVKSLDASGKQLKNLSLDFGLHGLHGPSTENLLELAQTSCNFQNLTQLEKDKLRTGLRTLLFEGFSVGIRKISGTVDGGELDGKWLVTLAKSQSDEFSLMPVLTSQGELTLTGKDIKPQQKKTLISMGIATATPDGVRASYEFANGVLKVNGKVSNAVLLDTALQNMDQQIRGFLTGQTIRSNGGGPAEEELEDPSPELET